jgi:ribosomal protein S27E
MIGGTHRGLDRWGVYGSEDGAGELIEGCPHVLLYDDRWVGFMNKPITCTQCEHSLFEASLRMTRGRNTQLRIRCSNCGSTISFATGGRTQ